jgi:anti-sigma regulatory factor (Ser/Thr protein kinase)
VVESLKGVSLRLAAAPASVGTARQAVDGLEWLSEQVEAAFNVRLLVTELVTNSIRHADLASNDEVSVDIQPVPAGVRVEVADPGEGFARPVFTEKPPAGTGGRGIYLVDALADRWGIERRQHNDAWRTVVWFELDT